MPMHGMPMRTVELPAHGAVQAMFRLLARGRVSGAIDISTAWIPAVTVRGPVAASVLSKVNETT